MSGRNRNCKNKVELQQTLYMECIRRKKKLKIIFLIEKRNMKQYRPKCYFLFIYLILFIYFFFFCIRVLSITILLIGKLVRLAITGDKITR